jgi:hypothetical protein
MILPGTIHALAAQKLQTTNLLCVVSFAPFATKRREIFPLKESTAENDTEKTIDSV